MPTEKKKKTEAKPAKKSTSKTSAARKAAAARTADKPEKAPKQSGRVTSRRKAAEPQITEADIARRAYFISEARYRQGQPGTAEGDWLEAERQLQAEAAAADKA